MDGNNPCGFKKFCKRIIVYSLLFFIISMSEIALTAGSENYKSGSIVVEAATGRVLKGYNYDAKLPMASTTKIVTALIVLDRVDVNKIITIPDKAVGIEGSSIYLKRGEKWKIIDLLYGMMLRSGNDAASALAISTGGSIEGFAKLMNEKAESLGLKNSNFVNPHGLHDDNHFTSAYDLAMLTREAMNYEIFRKIVSTKSYRFYKTDNTVNVFLNKNKMLNMYDGANGVKTGFTKKSGRCLVSSALRDNMQLITVVLNHGNMWGDSIDMMNNAFSAYKMYDVLKAGEMVGETKVVKSVRQSTMLKSNDTFSYPLTSEEISKLTYESNFMILKAPIKKDQYGGKVNIYLDKHLIFTANAYTIEDVKDKSVREHLKDILKNWKMKYENQ